MKRTTVTPEWMGEVRKRTKVNNMTSRDLAAACGWSESVVRKYINGLYYNDNPHRAHCGLCGAQSAGAE